MLRLLTTTADDLPHPHDAREVPLGDGAVPWEEYIGYMDETDYEGFYTIEREVGDDPASDIVRAKEFLDRW